MKKIYETPVMEVIEMNTLGFLAASDGNDWEEEGGGNSNPQAPGMMSFDDMDEDFIDEDNI